MQAALGTESGGPMGADGSGVANDDTFVALHSKFGPIAFVGPNPYLDSNGTNHWGIQAISPSSPNPMAEQLATGG